VFAGIQAGGGFAFGGFRAGGMLGVAAVGFELGRGHGFGHGILILNCGF
jgi:hypothetical protein